MHNDPIADMLTRIRNACRAKHKHVEIPASKIKVRIAEILKEEGFIEDYRSLTGKTPGTGVLEVKLRYDRGNSPVIGDVQRVSRPGLRRYLGYKAIPKVRNGLGIMILTTSRGLLSDKAARREKVGGEALVAVW